MVGGNYVNRFNLNGRSYEVIPQVPRSDRLTPESLGQYYVDDAHRRAGAAIDRGHASRPTRRPTRSPSTTSSTRPPSRPCRCRASPWARRSTFLEQQAPEVLPADFQHAYLSDSRLYVTEGNQLAVTFVFALIVIYPGAGRAVRIPARPVRDPGQRADVDLRRAAAAVLRPRYPEHLHPDRPRHPDRPDQQARHPDGGVRQRAAAQREPRPTRGDRARGPGAAAARS